MPMFGWVGFGLCWLLAGGIAAAMILWENGTIRRAGALSRRGIAVSPALSAVAEEGAIGLAEDGRQPGDRTTRDVVLGKRCARFLRAMFALALVLTTVVAAYVWAQVPLDTQIQIGNSRYGGRDPIDGPVWFAMCFFPITALACWGFGRATAPGRRRASSAKRRARPAGGPPSRSGRIFRYFFGSALAILLVFTQLARAQEALANAGMLPR